ncbi:MAG: putative PadR family transcriptional regulator [Myxococcales bacterium]|nr:putative PadR family transcriptional regulator [Myxococcales bacterium]
MARETSSSKGEIPKGALRAIVLSLLSDEPSHGYGLCQTLAGRTRSAFELSEGTLYPLLHELELEGLVEAKDGVSETGRKRRIYHLTRAGRRETESWRKHWLATAELITELLIPDAPARTRSR